MINQNAEATAELNIGWQVPGRSQGDISRRENSEGETRRKISRELKGQNTMTSHQGEGQSQVLTSTNQSQFNAAGHQCCLHPRQLAT